MGDGKREMVNEKKKPEREKQEKICFLRLFYSLYRFPFTVYPLLTLRLCF